MQAELTEAHALQPPSDPDTPEASPTKPQVSPHERHRLIAHLGRTFARRYDMQVIPSRQRGLWATGLDPRVSQELIRYIQGERDNLDDFPPEAFRPQQILYDQEGAMEMEMEEITTLLHHEAGHAKYTDFRLMFEGQRGAKDEGHLPTSFWLVFEGIEDPRVNSLEGEESPAIDRQIRRNQGNDIQKRITEMPITQRPMMLQFAFNSFHYWLHGEGIPELAGTEVGRVTELTRPLLEQYFQNTDVDERRLLQKQIWDIAKELEKKDIEQEEKRQMAQKKKGEQKNGEGQPGEQGQPGEGQGKPGQQGSGQGGGKGEAQPSVPGGQSSEKDEPQQAQPKQDKAQGSGRRRFWADFKKAFLDSPEDREEEPEPQSASGGGQDEQQPEAPQEQIKPEKIDLSELSEEELQEIEDAINQLSPEERDELMKQAREAIDEEQKDALEEELGRAKKLEKNKEGQYEVKPQIADEDQIKDAQNDYQEALEQAEQEEQEERDRQEEERRQQRQIQQQLDRERQEKIDMERAGFDPAERDKFLLYQALEDSMYGPVRNFRQAMDPVVPRRTEPVFEPGYFTGPKFSTRELVRRVPVGDERFHERQVEEPTGDPRLFIGLLIDNSISMASKRDQARKTAIFFSRIAREMGIPLMVSVFGDDAEVIKEFRQDFDDPKERIKPKMIDATSATGGGTNLHAGLEVTIEAMNEQRRRISDSHGLIFVITDGEANIGLTDDDLSNYIEENRGRLTYKAFGLSGNDRERQKIQEYLNKYFGESNCAYPQNFDDLPDEAFRMLRVNLMQFQRFLT